MVPDVLNNFAKPKNVEIRSDRIFLYRYELLMSSLLLGYLF